MNGLTRYFYNKGGMQMTLHDFLFWLISLDEIAPKRRYLFWELGRDVSDNERIQLVKKLCQHYKFRIPNMQTIKRLQALDTISILDESYPEQLKNIAQPPLVLFFRGDSRLLSQKNIAIVGSRTHTIYGQYLVESWVPKLVKSGYTTISGTAKGIDGIVHKSTLNSGGQTIAVLGHGLSFVYPKEHLQLLQKITQYGLVLTEYAPWVGPKPWRFPERNRIVVGLTNDVWVVEADDKSGSMVSAQIAIDENRQVWCVPADVHRKQAQGTNQLIQDGANVALNYLDIISL